MNQSDQFDGMGYILSAKLGSKESRAITALVANAPQMLDLLKRINHAFYVDGTAKALRPIMAETKALIHKAEGN